MNAPTQTSPTAQKLIKCGRRACSYVLWERERNWRERADDCGKTAVCPQCGNDDFYTLNAEGREINWRNDTASVSPYDIQPSARLGTKKREQLIAAKVRGLAALDAEGRAVA